MSSHIPLLHNTTVVLDGQNYWIAVKRNDFYKISTISQYDSFSPTPHIMTFVSPLSANVHWYFLILLSHLIVTDSDDIKGLALIHTYSDVTKACSLMVVKTSQNLIFVVRVCPW